MHIGYAYWICISGMHVGYAYRMCIYDMQILPSKSKVPWSCAFDTSGKLGQ